MASFRRLPALKCGISDAAISTGSPVLGFLPTRPSVTEKMFGLNIYTVWLIVSGVPPGFGCGER